MGVHIPFPAPIFLIGYNQFPLFQRSSCDNFSTISLFSISYPFEILTPASVIFVSIAFFERGHEFTGKPFIGGDHDIFLRCLLTAEGGPGMI